MHYHICDITVINASHLILFCRPIEKLRYKPNMKKNIGMVRIDYASDVN